MANKKCERSGCDTPLNTGTTYCSRSCAAKARHQKENISVSSSVPDSIAKSLISKLGDDAQVVIREMAVALESDSIPAPPPPLQQTTYSDIVLSFDGKKDMRPSSKLRFDIIDQMLRSGIVMFAMEMKRAQIARLFSEGHFKVVSPDKELAEIATASLNLILPKMASDFTFSAFAYGASFQEEVWEWKTKYQLGLSKSMGAVTEFLVPKVPNSVKVDTVDHIIRSGREFNGFAQTKDNAIGDNLIKVSREASLVIPLNERFGNLWGESFLKPLYVIWLWYEVTMRTMHRYMERMAMPVALGRAPAKGTVTVQGKSTPVRAMDLVLSVAGNVAKSNAVAIPSDRDESGNYLWDISYLTASERAQPFINVLEFLGQEIIRAALSADRSLSQSSGGVGSFNIGEVHAKASALTSEQIAMQFLFYLNKFFMPGFSLYNRGRNGPPIWIVTQAVDLAEREMLMKLLNTAGNTDSGNAFFDMINWREMAETGNVPILDEKEIKKIKEERLKESLDRQKKQQQMMQKFAIDGKLQPAKGQPDSSKVKEIEKNPEAIKQEAIDYLLGGGKIPLVLSLDDVTRLTVGDFDESKVTRDDSGRFSKKSGGGAKKVLSNEEQARLDELGLSPDKRSQVLALMNRDLKFASEQDAIDAISNALKELGIDVPNDVKFAVKDDMPEWSVGKYDPETNTFYMSSGMANDLKNGDPLAVNVAVHEIAHSGQEVNRGLSDYEKSISLNPSPGVVYDSDDVSQHADFVAHSEGINDLVTMMALSNMYGMPITHDLLSAASYTMGSSSFAKLDKGHAIKGVGYVENTRYAAALALDYQARGGGSAREFILRAHKNGFDQAYQRDIVQKVTGVPKFVDPKDVWPSRRDVYSDIDDSVDINNATITFLTQKESKRTPDNP